MTAAAVTAAVVAALVAAFRLGTHLARHDLDGSSYRRGFTDGQQFQTSIERLPSLN